MLLKKILNNFFCLGVRFLYFIISVFLTIDNCYKCDLETINDPNNSQYFWINRRDLEIESKRNWQVIFNKYKD